MSTADGRDPCRGEEAPPRTGRETNLPGRSSIDYRLGTHGGFLEGMLRRLPYAQVVEDGVTTTPLAMLLTQAKDDPAIALLDAWAVVEDVITFYQERLANEGFLRTAVDPRSVRELAQMLGYQPAPGVAAAVKLAFDVEDAQGAPGKAVVPAGTRVLSLPENGNLPQAFETSAEVEVRAEWNAMRPRLTRPPNVGAPSVWIEGMGLRLSPGDWMIAERGEQPPLLRRIVKVEVELQQRRTRLELDRIGETSQDTTADATPADLNVQSLADMEGRITETALRTLVDDRAWDIEHCQRHLRARVASPCRIKVSGQHMAFFGYNAIPSEREITIWSEDGYGGAQGSCVLEREVEQLSVGQHVVISGPFIGSAEGGAAHLALFKAIEVEHVPYKAYDITAKATRLVLMRLETPRDEDDELTPPFHFRYATASVGEQLVELAPERCTDPITANERDIELDGYVAGLRVGQIVILSGERNDLRGVTSIEEHVLEEITHDIQAGGVWTTLRLASQLQHDYVRETVRINANVVEATHGETVHEVLGSGDAAVANQKFRLRRGPLTHIPSSEGLGAKSTVEIWVDGVRWTQHESLYGLGPDDRGYVVDIDDKGTARVVFGDGVHGALLPTGIDNVEATYRIGIGLAGEAAPGKIMLMQQRPLGVRGVTNPRAATGAEDSEPRVRVRANAPLSVRTMGRVVSATDYEDFARAFAGVAKVKATRLWRGDREIVHLSVAGANGKPAGTELRQRLTAAIHGCSDPSQRFQVDGFSAVWFDLKVAVQVMPDRRPEDVLTAVEQQLRAAFTFDARDLAQDVHHSEIVALVQRVPGVVACRLEKVQPKLLTFQATFGKPAKTASQPVLRALPARAVENPKGGITIAPAQLLLLRTDGLQVVEIKEAP